ncbi:hypothetical protein [Cohnella sp. JJ-181]|uniref:hypothetical protein n=1 Tax=Cohnella rhizoplanae TaxID=2974897 RepID=UPI0022FF64DC|nr:hypothetical protein [Cohnella sp. JJ-181]CAI6052082.1 hypothetical protein COHCIP112018_01517 [Cohnella sp. JJ-181]
MEHLYLFHYYEAKLGPFKNLSSLSPDEAQKIMDALKAKNNVYAARRSDDYLYIRKDIEEKARKLFVLKGGQPRKTYPHYLTLGRCDWLKDWYNDGRELKIRLDDFSPHVVSFTYGDLFPTMRYRDDRAYRGQVYTLQEMKTLIERYGWPQVWNREGNNGPERYIEAQVWDDDVVQMYF